MYAAALLAPGVPVVLSPKATKVFITVSKSSVDVFLDSPATGRVNRNIQNSTQKRRYAFHRRLYTELLPLRLKSGTDLFGYWMLDVMRVGILNLIRQMLYWFNWLNWLD
jgi:hypothetical protein